VHVTRARLIALLIFAFGTSAMALPATASAAFDDTSTTVSCSPASVATGAPTTCKATVSDTTTPSSTPTGTVNFSASPGSGQFDSCTLNASGVCQVNFTPGAGGDYTVSAAYSGDTNFQPSSDTTSVTAVDPTTLTLSCSPSTVSINSSTRCTADLTDPNGGPAPAGKLTFGSAPSGSFGPVSCQSGTSSAACQVSFTPGTPGHYTVTADYSGDTHHAKASASTGVTATTTPAGGGPGSHGGGGGGGNGTVTINVSPGSPPPGTATVAPRGTVSKRHVARLLLTCKGGAGSRCIGTLVLTTQIKVKVKVPIVSRGKRHSHGKKHRRRFKIEKQTKTILVGLAGYNLAAGSTQAMLLKVKKGALKTLAHHRRLKTLAATASGSRTVTLSGPKPKKKHHKKKHHHKKHHK
jgi:hypothetical protein